MSTGAESGVPPVPGVATGDWNELVARGRRRGRLTAEEIVDVLHDVELSPEAIESIRHAIEGAGIVVDQSFEIDDSGELRRPLLESSEIRPTSSA
ncbi:MAG: RNA polymerase sigma factor region1.1 domain-containing protein [Ilumatobacteraceae bacterium]